MDIPLAYTLMLAERGSDNGYDLRVPTFPHRFPKAHERLFKDLRTAYNRSLVGGKGKEKVAESATTEKLIQLITELVYSITDVVTGERLVLSESEEKQIAEAIEAEHQRVEAVRQRELQAAKEEAERAKAEAERVRLALEAEQDRQQIVTMWAEYEQEKAVSEAETLASELAINNIEVAELGRQETERRSKVEADAVQRSQTRILAAINLVMEERDRAIAQAEEATTALAQLKTRVEILEGAAKSTGKQKIPNITRQGVNSTDMEPVDVIGDLIDKFKASLPSRCSTEWRKPLENLRQFSFNYFGEATIEEAF